VNYFLPILARGDDNDFMKFVFGVVVVVLWGFGALVSAINKRAEAERRRRMQYEQLARESGMGGGGSVGYGPPPVPARIPGGQRPKQKQKQPKQRKRIAVATPPTLPGQRAAAEPAAHPAYQPAVAGGSTAPIGDAPAAPRAGSGGAASASRVARLLRRPDTLRAAFILSEILAPPPSIKRDNGSPPRV
jgi:hypothetical protein